MILTVLLAAAALVWKGDCSPAGPQTVVALAGEAVILPCSFDISSTKEFPTIEWSKADLTPDVVLLHRDGCEIQEMKNGFYEHRTSLVLRELRNGNVSLRLGALRYGDGGRYRCKTLWREGPDRVSEVELIVAAVAMPTLTVMAVGVDGVTVLCDSGCWTPRPLVELLEDDGEEIHPQALEEERRSQTGCFRVQVKAELQSATRSVTCRVRQREFNHSRRTTIILPDLCLFHHRTVGVAIGLTVVCCFSFFAVVVGFWTAMKNHKKKKKRSLQRESTDQTSVNMGGEDKTLLSSERQVACVDGGGANRNSERACSTPSSPSALTPPTGSCASTPGNENRKEVLEKKDSASSAYSSSSSSSSSSSPPGSANTSLNRLHPHPLLRQDSFSSAYQSASSSVIGEAPPIARSLPGPTHGGVQSLNPPLNKPRNGVAKLSNKARKPDPQEQKVNAATPTPATTPTGSVLTPTGSVLTPTGPVFTPTGPVFTPTGSVLTPTGPVFTPMGSVLTPTGPVFTPMGSVLTPTARSLTRPTHGGVQSSNPPLNKPQNGVDEPSHKARKPDPQKQKVTAAAPAPATAPASSVVFRHVQKEQRKGSCPTLPTQNPRSSPTNRRRTSFQVSPQQSSNRFSTLANHPDSR